MRNNIITVALFLSTLCLAQTNTDSTVAKNKQMIEELKNRINAIDNIGNGSNTFQKQIDDLRAELLRQNDSVTKLLTIINDLKKFAPLNNTEQKIKTSLLINSKDDRLSYKSLSDNEYNLSKKQDAEIQNYISSCNCTPMFYKPYQIDLNFKTITDLNEVIKKYESNPNHKIVIVGHADKSGSEDKTLIYQSSEQSI